MGEVTTIGVDLAKSVFQVHGVDAAGETVVQRQLRRRQVIDFFARQPSCRVGLEACATAHYWAREIGALGHEVHLMPPRYVKPYVKRNKTDMADAEAICEALTRPSMRFVPVKTAEQQAVLMLHRTRQLLVRQRTMLINALRAHLAEFGLVARVGRHGLERLLQDIEAEENRSVPAIARTCLLALRAQLVVLKQQILEVERRILDWHRASALSQRLAEIPGVGPLIATALVASVTDPGAFKSGRDLAAWIGLTPRQNSSGGKQRLGHISKAGDRYLRTLLVLGALSVVRRARQTGLIRRPWLARLLQHRPMKVAAVALANRNARTAWAMMRHGTVYQEPVAPMA